MLFWTSHDQRIVYGYTDGLRTTITADVPGGGDQVTTYTFGTTKGVSAGDSEIATGHLLQKVAYPDSTGSSDTVTYAYDAQGRQDWMKDQSGNIIETIFDNAGREVSRAVTTLASGFNGDVRRIETSYTNRGQVENVTQYDAASSGSIVDQVEYAYTRHGGVEYFYQDMNSAVDTGAGDHYSIQYGWELSTGGRESWRRTGVIMPSGNTLTYQYSSGIDDEVSRLSIIKDDSLRLAEYDYLGYIRVVGQTYAIPDLMQECYGSTSGDNSGLDRFGRVVRSRWQRDTGSGDIDVYDVELAYDRNSNITLAEDAIIPGRDVEYTMDGLNRLVQAEEGTWSGSAITSQSRDEQWTLDHLGNWDSHQLDLNGDTDYVDADELDETRTHNAVNELLTRDLDSDMSTDETLAYNAVGELTDDGAEWKYVYDAFGRLCEVKDQSNDLVAEYRYNGLGFQIAEHTDTDVDGDVDGSDLWYYSAFDERWRKLATFRSSDSDPKEEFVPHNAGLNGMGGSSYINDTVLRDKDVDEDVNHILEQRIFYLNNWRGDVVGLVTSTGYQGEFVRYSAYGTPFNYPGGDANSDGETNATDGTVISGWVSAMTYDVRGDLDLDGDVDAADHSAYGAAYAGANGGQKVLSDEGFTCGSGGMQYTEGGAYRARRRHLDVDNGKWESRDPLGYFDGYSLSQFAISNPIVRLDPFGLLSSGFLGGGNPVPLDEDAAWTAPPFFGPAPLPSGSVTLYAPLQGPGLVHGGEQSVCERKYKELPPTSTKMQFGLTTCVNGKTVKCIFSPPTDVYQDYMKNTAEEAGYSASQVPGPASAVWQFFVTENFVCAGKHEDAHGENTDCTGIMKGGGTPAGPIDPATGKPGVGNSEADDATKRCLEKAWDKCNDKFKTDPVAQAGCAILFDSTLQQLPTHH